MKLTRFKDYYFQPIFEAGQPELVELHRYTYMLDYFSLLRKQTGAGGEDDPDAAAQLGACVHAINQIFTGDSLTGKQTQIDRLLQFI